MLLLNQVDAVQHLLGLDFNSIQIFSCKLIMSDSNFNTFFFFGIKIGTQHRTTCQFSRSLVPSDFYTCTIVKNLRPTYYFELLYSNKYIQICISNK